MALTVEELQIVLKCDATTAQEVLKQMDATVKAYTEKFQKYFQTRTGKVQPLDNVAKQVDSAVRKVESQTKRLKKAAADWKEQYKKTWGEDFDSSMMKAKIRSSVDRMGKEYKPSGQKYVGSGGGMGDPNYFRNSEAYNTTYGNRAPDKELVEFGAKIRATLEDSLGSVNTISGAMRMKIGDALVKLRDLANEYHKAVTEHGADSPQATAAEQKYKKAIYAADGYIQKLDKVAAKEQSAKQKIDSIKNAASSARKRLSDFGTSLKKAFNQTLLGKFLKQLGRTMLRMAAMKVIRGTIQGISQGLEELAKKSKSSAKAMNTINGAGNSIKMSLGMAVMPIVKALAPVFVQLAGVVNTACNALARFFAVVTGQSTYTAVNFSNALDGVSESADGAGKSAKRAVAAFDELNIIGQKGGGGGGGTDLTNPFSQVTGDLPAFSELGTKIREAIEKGDWRGVGAAIAGKLNEAVDSWQPEETARKISKKINDALDLALGFVETLNTKQLGEKIATFLSEIEWGEILSKVIHLALYDLPTKVNEFLSGFIQTMDWAGVANGIITGLSNGLLSPEGIESLTSSFFELLGSVVGAIVRFKIEEYVNLVEWAKSVAQSFVNVFKNEDGTLKTGEEIWNGICEGLLNAVNGVYTWIKTNIFDPFIDGFKKAFGIASPAKEMNEPGDMVGQGILEGIAAPFKAIGTWLNDHIVQPIKDWFAENVIDIDIDLKIKDLKEFGTEWKGLKGGKKTFEAKLSGVKDAVIEKIEKSWNNIDDNDATLTASVPEGLGPEISSIEKPWKELKGGTKTLTVNRAGTKVFDFDSVRAAWDTITGNKSAKLTTSWAAGSGWTSQNVDTTLSMFDLPSSFNPKVTPQASVSAAVSSFIKSWNALTDKKVTIQAVSDKFKETWNSIAAKWNASSFLRGIFTMPTLASGGVTYGPTMAMIGEYAGAKSNPEVIAPLSTLVGLLQRANATGTNKDAMTKEQADVMIRLLQRIEQKSNVIVPSVALGQVMSRSANLYART